MEDIEGQNPVDTRETEVQNRLEGFLNDNHQLVGAIRSRNQWRAAAAAFHGVDSAKERAAYQTFNQVDDLVLEEIHKLPEGVHIPLNLGVQLCDVRDDATSDAPNHGNEFREGDPNIRGSKFRMEFIDSSDDTFKQTTFFIFENDFGKSRAYFDSKDEEGKREFVRNFALREIAVDEEARENLRKRAAEQKPIKIIAGFEASTIAAELRFNTGNMLKHLANWYVLGRRPKAYESIREVYGAFITIDPESRKYRVEELVPVITPSV